MKYASNTDIGLVRKLNEDYHMNYITDDFSLLVVCDGMGGHKAGEVAVSYTHLTLPTTPYV